MDPKKKERAPDALTKTRGAKARIATAMKWMRVDDAAGVLGMNVIPLRRAIERHARRDADGHLCSAFDGVRARKLGRHWRVALDPCWSLAASA